MQQLLCDNSACREMIQDGSERIDVSLPTRRDPISGLSVPGGLFNFHVPCFQSAGALLPAPGLSVTVTRVAATTPPVPESPAEATLPDPIRAPA